MHEGRLVFPLADLRIVDVAWCDHGTPRPADPMSVTVRSPLDALRCACRGHCYEFAMAVELIDNPVHVIVNVAKMRELGFLEHMQIAAQDRVQDVACPIPA